MLRDADSARVLWARSVGAGLRDLQWSADGRFLLAVSARGATLYSGDGSRVWATAARRGAPVIDAALAPDGHAVAMVLGGSSPEAVVEGTTGRPAAHRVLSGVGLRQVLWSPDDRWLLISWPAANQWVFVRVAGPKRIAAVSHIVQQFSGGQRRGAFPQLEGWCCTAAR
jgi:hypothetical protein